MNIFEHNNYHFIGIGGIGISAIARMLVLKGKKVTGSDSGESSVVEDLRSLGVHTSIGQTKENIPTDAEVVIYTIAIKEDNEELMEAKNRNIVCLTYPEALGKLTENMYTIAISGTHGKTTTTAMVGHILQKEGLDPTIVVGSKMIDESTGGYTNFIAGKSKYLVVEACEYRRSFLNLSPTILAINNIEADHLDYYKDLKDVQDAFHNIATKVPKDGAIIANLKEKNTREALENISTNIYDYSQVEIDEKIGVPGEHNIENAKVAVQIAEILGIKKEDAIEDLKSFKGTWRRLEYKGKDESENIFYDDYAHHPTEIEASLKALKGHHPDRKIVCVFEPHQQSRLKMFFDDFVKSLSIADYALIAPIFLSRETDDGITTNKGIVEKIKEHTKGGAIENTEELKQYLKNTKQDGPFCVVLMGAGDIYKWTKDFI